MNITKHAKTRYVERYVSLPEGQNVNAYLTLNEDKVTKWIQDEFEHATKFFTGQMKSKNSCNYYIVPNANRIYITDTDDNSIITTYPTEFGFGDEVDATIANMVIKQLQETHQKHETEHEKNMATLQDLYAQRDTAQETVKSMEEKLSQAKQDVKLISDMIDLTVSDNTKLGKEEQEVAYKLINSKYYMKEVQDKIV